MNLDIIAQLVQILRDAPELAAIEVRRGLFGAWCTVRVSKAAHMTNAGGGPHLVVAAPGVAAGSPLPPAAGGAAPGEAGGARREAAPPSHLLDIKSPMVGTFYTAPQPGAGPLAQAGRPRAPRPVPRLHHTPQILQQNETP